MQADYLVQADCLVAICVSINAMFVHKYSESYCHRCWSLEIDMTIAPVLVTFACSFVISIMFHGPD